MFQVRGKDTFSIRTSEEKKRLSSGVLGPKEVFVSLEGSSVHLPFLCMVPGSFASENWLEIP